MGCAIGGSVFVMGNVAFRLTKDDISPHLRAAYARVKNPQPVLHAMGTTFMSITQGTFNSVGASYRPIPWKAKIDGSPSNLQKSTTLAKAFHLNVTTTLATVSNSTIYARIHQLGGVIKPKTGKYLKFKIGDRWVSVKQVTMPARPFFPVLNGQLTPKAGEKIIGAAERVIMKELTK